MASETADPGFLFSIRRTTRGKRELPMKEVSIWNLKPGDMLAKSVFSPSGQVLLKEGKRVTQPEIDRLRKLRVTTVFIREPQQGNAESDGQIRSDESDEQHVIRALLACADSRNAREMMTDSEAEKRFLDRFRRILSDLAAHSTLVGLLTELYRTDAFLFRHSLRVAVSAGILGAALGYDDDRLRELTIGALCFDIGMTRLPSRLWQNERVLNEKERAELENHPVIGYRLLSRCRDIPPASAVCALQHHERFDGEGYPQRLKGSEIHPYASIVAICDVYHALISPRRHRAAYSRKEAVEFLFASGGFYFDFSLVRTFLRQICIYPVHCSVSLSNGDIGVVSFVDADIPHRPVVKIVRKADGTPVHPLYEIDLRRNVDIVVVDLV